MGEKEEEEEEDMESSEGREGQIEASMGGDLPGGDPDAHIIHLDLVIRLGLVLLLFCILFPTGRRRAAVCSVCGHVGLRSGGLRVRERGEGTGRGGLEGREFESCARRMVAEDWGARVERCRGLRLKVA